MTVKTIEERFTVGTGPGFSRRLELAVNRAGRLVVNKVKELAREGWRVSTPLTCQFLAASAVNLTASYRTFAVMDTEQGMVLTDSVLREDLSRYGPHPDEEDDEWTS